MARILIVEDDVITAMDLENMLHEAGHEIVSRVEDGNIAVYIAQETELDLLLMDIKLKGKLDGVEAARRILERKNLPIVFLTAYSDDMLERVKEMRTYGYLIKPFQKSQVQTTIELALNQWAKDQEEGRKFDLVESFRFLLSNTLHAALLIDEDFRILATNKQGCGLFDLAEDKMLGHELWNLLDIDERKPLEESMLDLDAKPPRTAEVREVRLGNPPRTAQLIVSRVPGEPSQFLILFQDGRQPRNVDENSNGHAAQVEELKISLRNVLGVLEEEKLKFKNGIAHQIEVEIMPTLEKMAREDSPEVRETYKALLFHELWGLAKGCNKELESQLLGLTATEMRICQYVLAGRSTKEIAETMNSAFETIQTHRKNIRRKLGLRGKDTSLYIHLKSMKALQPEWTGN